MRKRYKLKEKGFKLVMEELKRRIKAKAFKAKWFTSRIQQYRQNRLFEGNQKALYQELSGDERQNQMPSNENKSKEILERSVRERSKA